jgi:hypothetical protein
MSEPGPEVIRRVGRVVDPAQVRARAPHGRMAGGDLDGRCRFAATTSTDSCRPSPATIATLPTTSRTRCWPINRLRSAVPARRRCFEG